MTNFKNSLAVTLTAIIALFASCGNNDGVATAGVDSGDPDKLYSIVIDESVPQIVDEFGGKIPSVSADLASAKLGTKVTLTVSLDAGYVLDGASFKVNGSITPTAKNDVDRVGAGTYTFTMPAAKATVRLAWVADDIDIVKALPGVNQDTLRGLYADSGDLFDMDNNLIDPEVEDYFDTYKDKTDFKAIIPYSMFAKTDSPSFVTALPENSGARVSEEIDNEASVASAINGYGEAAFDYKLTITPQLFVLYPPQDYPEIADLAQTNVITIHVTRLAASTDKSLAAFNLSEAYFEFESATLDYGVVDILFAVTTVNFNAAVNEPNARVQLVDSATNTTVPADVNDAGSYANAEFPITGGQTKTFKAKVTAEDNSTQTYTVQVKINDAAYEPNATGGELSFLNIDGTVYEIHAFKVDEETPAGGQTVSSLEFTNNQPASIEVLVVAGGGGGGGSTTSYRSGGGGGGGLIYNPAYNLDGGVDTYTVKTGNGGAGGVGSGNSGNNGGASVFGDEDARLEAPGGGGGGKSGGTGGKAGGSGGGASRSKGEKNNPSAVSAFFYNGAAAQPNNVIAFGKAGGYCNSGNYGTCEGLGAGGGGAGGAGEVRGAANATKGGAGKQIGITGSLKWYCGGGAGGGSPSLANVSQMNESHGAKGGNSGDANTGDGGSGAGGSSIVDGGAGGSGIVVVRWPY
jgi:hypothetical protein